MFYQSIFSYMFQSNNFFCSFRINTDTILWFIGILLIFFKNFFLVIISFAAFILIIWWCYFHGTSWFLYEKWPAQIALLLDLLFESCSFSNSYYFNLWGYLLFIYIWKLKNSYFLFKLFHYGEVEVHSIFSLAHVMII